MPAASHIVIENNSMCDVVVYLYCYTHKTCITNALLSTIASPHLPSACGETPSGAGHKDMPIQLEWYLTCYIENSDIYNWIKMRLCCNEFYNNIHSNMLHIDNVHTK